MTPELENIIRKLMAKDIEIKMFEKKADGLIITDKIVIEILKELTDVDEDKAYESYKDTTIDNPVEFYQPETNI